MLSELIRARLQQLQKEFSGTVRELRQPLGRGANSHENVPEIPSGADDDWQAHGEQVENSSGKHWRIRRELTVFWPHGDTLIDQAGASTSSVRERDGQLLVLAEHFPRSAVFLDLETCGFAGSSVFLAGVVRNLDDTLVVEQHFARDYTEERAVLESLWQALAESRVLVTFNGKSFDWPMVRDRTTRHRLDKVIPLAGQFAGPTGASAREFSHCDLLHVARRRWKTLLPNCKLQTLERYVCRRHRRGDLGGAEVPAAYHAFVRSGDGRQIGAILHHNALDLATLVELAARLLAA